MHEGMLLDQITVVFQHLLIQHRCTLPTLVLVRVLERRIAMRGRDHRPR